jgi:protoporphyrinogen/coproporphyrinogen III oxidase
MRPRLPENILVTLLRQCYLAPMCGSSITRPPLHSRHNTRSFRSSSRQLQQHGPGNEQGVHVFRGSIIGIDGEDFAVTKSVHQLLPIHKPTQNPSSHPSKNIAVLGGGITGLASAFWLSEELQTASITLYEASDRLGGWLRSKHVDVGNGNIVFEQGPRTIRPHGPSALFTLELVIAPEVV